MNVAIVIPALNEVATIAQVVRLVSVHGNAIVVDDGSTDATSGAARAAGASVVRHAENRGYDAAIDSGFRAAQEAGAELVITFDADGQHSAATLAKMISQAESGQIDMVLGVRRTAARFGEHLFNLYIRRRFGVADILCGLKAYRMHLYDTYGPFDREPSIGTRLALDALRGGARMATVAVPIASRLDRPRMGTRWRANARIIAALVRAVGTDLRGSWKAITGNSVRRAS